MNKLLSIIGIWGVIMGTINLHHGVEHPIPSMICLGLSIWVSISSLNELDRKNIKASLEEYFKSHK